MKRTWRASQRRLKLLWQQRRRSALIHLWSDQSGHESDYLAALYPLSQSKKKKKKSKVSTAASTDPATPSHVTASSSTPAGKKKQPKTATKEDDGMDEFEKALAELKLKFPDEGKAGSQGARSGEDKPSGRLALGLRYVPRLSNSSVPNTELTYLPRPSFFTGICWLLTPESWILTPS